MAKTDALNIFLADGIEEDKLREVYGQITGDITKNAVSQLLKNTNLSGDPAAGSVVVRRLAAANVRALGTAKTANEGDAVRNLGVTINLDDRREIVETLSNFDVRQYGYENLIESRRDSFTKRWESYLDTAFFTEAISAGTELTPDASTVEGKFEELVVAIEETKNDNVDGVDRSMISVVCSPTIYSELRLKIHTYPNPVDGGVMLGRFNDVRVFSSHRLPAGTDMVAMMDGSIAQPVAVEGFGVIAPQYTPESALQLFFAQGTKAVMADLIRYVGTTVSA